LADILFYIFAVISIAGAISVVSSNNPVSSALFLVLTLASTAVLFILLSAYFIAVIQILIYAGAIMVLFLFTVMFLNLRTGSDSFDKFKVHIRVMILFLIIAITGLLTSFGFRDQYYGNATGGSVLDDFGTVKGVGSLLFTDYLLPFELTSVLIIVAIIGVVVIAKRRVD